jgi:protein-L-isoaspartate(D-aspartate) O-methyltransferase
MTERHLQGIGMTSQRTRDRMFKRLIAKGIDDKRVLEIMRTTPRHIFVEEALASRAYEDTALPIGYNQTISQPYTVAKMTQLLLENYDSLARVLEIGTGCGYQTAVLAQLVGEVFSVERILPLQKRAIANIELLKLKNVRYKHEDGGWGWAEFAPFDGILVAAAPTEIPLALLEQLAVGGVMVIPIDDGQGNQLLQRITREETRFQIETLEPVSFVPFLTGIE